ncbi:phosphotransferase [Paenibacillus pinihumi]|uniref:phosphotransferase n=1 Tax=Paenibacillus pinihumi TaxID=669462 RepID=UPI000413E648|nr:phosphotransferase [Paenibacillus pinihumi]
MANETESYWADEIAVHLKNRFGISVKEATTIDKGWLNVKWKIDTDNGSLFIKYYHPDRYRMHTNPERRRAIEKTLQLQQGLNAAGIPCPGVYTYKDQYIQETPSGLLYTVLDWVDGHSAQAGYLSKKQMFELGTAVGRMHKWLQAVPPLSKPAWEPDKEAYLRDWQINWDKAKEAEDTIVMEWLERSRDIVHSLDFRLFEACPSGWLHWDLWVDNILVHGQGLAGIVDFDRMTMAYPEIDVARAILSGSLQNGQLRMETVQAFMEGYRGYYEAPHGMLSRAIKMLYIIESIWWLRTEVRVDSGLRTLLGRFVEEMHWIEDQWPTLADRLDDV